MSCIRIEFHAVCVFVTDDIPCKFNDRQLHTKAETKERNVVCTGVFDCCDLTFYTTMAKSTRNKNTAYVREEFFSIFFCYSFGIDPFDIYCCVCVNSAVF